jgi:replicative DNA helicase
VPFLSDLVGPVYEELARRMTSSQPAGLTTGIPAVDELVGGGWVRQQLSYLVGDSGVGKSWLASSFMLRGAQWLIEHPDERPATGYVLTGTAEQDAVRQAVLDKAGKPPIIVFWSLEMAESPIITRLMAQLGKEMYDLSLDSGRLMRGNLGVQQDTPDWDAVMKQLQALYWLLRNDYGKHIFMEFEAHSLSQFRAILNELVVTYDVCLVVVDYFRLIEEIAYDGSMATLQAERSKSLKAVSKEYDCHVLSIFDINREGQKSAGINVNQMKGGTAAQYDADLVMTVAVDNDGVKVSDKSPPPTHKHLVLRVGKGRHVANSYIDLRMTMATGFVELWDQRDGGMTGWRGEQERGEHEEG